MSDSSVTMIDVVSDIQSGRLGDATMAPTAEYKFTPDVDKETSFFLETIIPILGPANAHLLPCGESSLCPVLVCLSSKLYQSAKSVAWPRDDAAVSIEWALQLRKGQKEISEMKDALGKTVASVFEKSFAMCTECLDKLAVVAQDRCDKLVQKAATVFEEQVDIANLHMKQFPIADILGGRVLNKGFLSGVDKWLDNDNMKGFITSHQSQIQLKKQLMDVRRTFNFEADPGAKFACMTKQSEVAVDNLAAVQCLGRTPKDGESRIGLVTRCAAAIDLECLFPNVEAPLLKLLPKQVVDKIKAAKKTKKA